MYRCSKSVYSVKKGKKLDFTIPGINSSAEISPAKSHTGFNVPSLDKNDGIPLPGWITTDDEDDPIETPRYSFYYIIIYLAHGTSIL